MAFVKGVQWLVGQIGSLAMIACEHLVDNILYVYAMSYLLDLARGGSPC